MAKLPRIKKAAKSSATGSTKSLAGKKLESGATHEEIAANANIVRSMVTRKFTLWDNLSAEVIEHILKLKYEKDTGERGRFWDGISMLIID